MQHTQFCDFTVFVDISFFNIVATGIGIQMPCEWNSILPQPDSQWEYLLLVVHIQNLG